MTLVREVFVEFNYTDSQLLEMTASDVFKAIRDDNDPFNEDDLDRWWYVHHWDN